MKIEPTRGRLFVRVDEPPETSPGGVALIPSTQRMESVQKCSTGEVLAVGPGVTIPVESGDRIWWEPLGGIDVEEVPDGAAD
jgi:co-chaperonin GroES (HSP10)